MKIVKKNYMSLFLLFRVTLSVYAQQQVDLTPYYTVNALAHKIEKSEVLDSISSTALKNLPKLALDGAAAALALKTRDLNTTAFDSYFFLLTLNKGATPLEAKMTGKNNTSMSEEFNENYYKKISYYLINGGDELQKAYLKEVVAVFRFNGYTSGLNQVLPVVKEYVKAGKEKDNVLDLYKKYDHTQIGKVAPNFTLPNDCDEMVSLSDFKDKVVVIDAWATWCHWCISKMPHYIELKNKYKGRNDIVFLSVSIDDYVKKYEWKYTIPNIGLLGFTNLLASAQKTSFQKDYMITGAPRYMVIDKAGRIVNLYLPGADSKTMSDAINGALEN